MKGSFGRFLAVSAMVTVAPALVARGGGLDNRCGASENKPFCDGSQKNVGFTDE